MQFKNFYLKQQIFLNVFVEYKVTATINLKKSDLVKRVQDKCTWDIISPISNDLMTINGSELLRRVLSFLNKLVRQQKANFATISQKLLSV